LIIINIESYTISLCFENDKSMMKFIVQFCLDFLKIKSDCSMLCDLCLTSLTRWHVEQMSTYSFTFLFMLLQKYFLFNKSNVFSCSKWSTHESSWFCFRSSLLKKFEKMYHLFFQRNKSFSIFHLNDESKSTFLRLLYDTTSSSLSKSRRFVFSFSLSYFIDVFSTKNRIRCANELNCCRMNNTMRSFKNKALNVVFLLKTFFIQFFEARSSLFATFSNRNVLEIFSISRNDDLKKKNFKILFTIAMIFFFFKKLCAFLTIEIFALFSKLLFAKQLFFDVSSIVLEVFDELLSAFDKTNCRWLIDWKKYVFFFFSFLLVRVFLLLIKTHSLRFKFSLFLFSFAISFS
jgi:hypothetical protein